MVLGPSLSNYRLCGGWTWIRSELSVKRVPRAAEAEEVVVDLHLRISSFIAKLDAEDMNGHEYVFLQSQVTMRLGYRAMKMLETGGE